MKENNTFGIKKRLRMVDFIATWRLEMELDEYLFIQKTNCRQLAKELCISEVSVGRYKKKMASPSLLTAIKLYIHSKGQVDFKEMLGDEDKETLEEWKS